MDMFDHAAHMYKYNIKMYLGSIALYHRIDVYENSAIVYAAAMYPSQYNEFVKRMDDLSKYLGYNYITCKHEMSYYCCKFSL